MRNKKYSIISHVKYLELKQLLQLEMRIFLFDLENAAPDFPHYRFSETLFNIRTYLPWLFQLQVLFNLIDIRTYLPWLFLLQVLKNNIQYCNISPLTFPVISCLKTLFNIVTYLPWLSPLQVFLNIIQYCNISPLTFPVISSLKHYSIL